MEIIYNLGGIVGIIALGGILYGIFTRPRLKIKYEAKSDLRQWRMGSGHADRMFALRWRYLIRQCDPQFLWKQ